MNIECKVTEIKKKKKGDVNPIIVEFLNGDIADDKLSDLSVTLTPHEQLSINAIEIKSPDGQSYKTNAVSDKPLATGYVAVRNRKTNKVKLVEAEFTTMINSLLLAAKEQENPVTADWKKQTSAFNQIFGTKKAIKHMERSEALNVDTSLVEEEINVIAAESKDISLEINHQEDISSTMIPPCHRDAKLVAEIYRLEDIITNEELISLSGGAKEMLENEDSRRKLSEFFETSLKKAKTFEVDLEKRVAVLLYAESLINYMKVPAKSLRGMMYKLCSYSKVICSKIIDEFCLKSGNILHRPLAMRDKSICYIIILTLIACNYFVDLELLAKETAYGLKKMKQLGRVIGAVPVKKDANTYVLKLPLPAPQKLVRPEKRKK